MMAHPLLALLVLIGVGSPATLLAVLGVTSLLNRPLDEKPIGRLTAVAMVTSGAALTAALAGYGAIGKQAEILSYGSWTTLHEGGIPIQFLVDRFALIFGALSAWIVAIVSTFSNRYLHRESGYNRYFTLLAMFVTGMLLVALAGNVEVLFIGWEFVGLSSALLVGFFHVRPAPVSNALRVFSVYRISDAAMLTTAVLLRHYAGSDSLSLLFGRATSGSTVLSGAGATLIALFLILAVAGKSALLPFSGWLPRAMEGPTPSSAVYYGSLSIHAGCFLLLRAAPLLEQAPASRIVAGALGLGTAFFAGTTTRVQSDVKSSLAYASLTQVGIIVFEIAIGWYLVAFIHMIGHACFRLLQFLSAPNVLHDLHEMEDAVGGQLPRLHGYMDRLASVRARRVLYLVALERGFLDSIIDRALVDPFICIASQLSRLDRWLCEALVAPSRMPAIETTEALDE
jgi:NAD(P)H-quinone oxidoreductase subunit 5